MKSTNLIIKLSPFVFIKRLAVLEFVFAFLPTILALVFGVERYYAASIAARTVSFSIVLTAVTTTIQIFIIALVFIWWYVPSYVVSTERITLVRGGLFEARELARTYAITQIEVAQGALGRKFDYGTLALFTSDAAQPVHLRDVPNPAQYARLIEEMVLPELAPQAQSESLPPLALIAAGETQHVEFKASLQWDYRQEKRNKDLYEPVMKNLAAFMNTVGGVVLIGVADDGQVLGLTPDYQTMGKQDSDGFENVFNMAFNTMIGAEYRQFVDVSFPVVAGQEICMAAVRPSPEPVFLTHKGEERFYIRTGNTSQWLTVSKAARYIRTRFNGGG
ncbi:MAG: RNA-binding domain-containing protein [Candidatus Promineifilaceae bacterium]